MDTPIGKTFSTDETRNAVIPAYMGLIKQCDDQMGVLFDWLEETGRMEDTMIVLTSDHGDFLGDHWMGEKSFFQNTSVKIPLIIYDPSQESDATRGTVCDALVECIDFAPTFVDVAGGEIASHILEGKSLLPLLHGKVTDLDREFVICEYDYSSVPVANRLGISARDAVLFMVANKEWKLIHCEGFDTPILFDLINDPDELVDLGTSADHEQVIEMMYKMLFKWARRNSQRTTRSPEQLMEMRKMTSKRGVVIGVYDENDMPLEFTTKYRNQTAEDRRSKKQH